LFLADCKESKNKGNTTAGGDVAENKRNERENDYLRARL
jgi:hypothetical protein